MAYSNDMALAMPPPPPPIGIAGRGYISDILKGQNRRHTRPRGKGHPFDPDDLRRRLYVVIAEQEAQEAKRQKQRGRVDSLRAKTAQLEKESERKEMDNLRFQRMGPSSSASTAPAPGRPAPIPKSRSRSRSGTRAKPSLSQEKLRPKPPTTTAVMSEVDASIGAAKAAEAGFPYVPAQAASQFRRTTTSERMREKSLVHSLSKAALLFYAEGTTAADREAIHSSLTPGKQQSILRRARGQRDRQHVRNQFQEHQRGSDASHNSHTNKAGGSEGGRRRLRPKTGGMNEIAIIEEEELSALADLHLHSLAGQGQGQHQQNDEEELPSSEDTLVDPGVAVNERRIDWTQSDEVIQHGKRGVGGGMTKLTPLLLRKTSSILKLGGKLGGHLRRNSVDDSHNNSSSGTDGNKLRIVTTNMSNHEHQHQHVAAHRNEGGEIEPDDGSTPMSPNSGSSRSGRPGMWGRLKRL